MKDENVLLVGNRAREHMIAEALTKSSPRPKIFAWMKANNPGIASLAQEVRIGQDYADVLDFAKHSKPDLAIIGPEDALAHEVADDLENCGIPTVGPSRELARIETEKSFARRLIEKYDIPGNPKFKVFKTADGIKEYLEENMPLVLKPDGLTGGKGVMVQGEHFTTAAEALKICLDILTRHRAVVIEEKLEGQEFTVQCLCDGTNVIAMLPVQDYKRRLVNDQGLNTGSMGSYSCADHLLPFLSQNELRQAVKIVRQTVRALWVELNQVYKGIIYGGFMITRQGLKLIEFNARFGNPEDINVLSLLKTDFLDICHSIVWPQKYGGLDQLGIKFSRRATVVKYVTPVNYGLPEAQWVKTNSDLIQVGNLGKAKLYYASVHADEAGYHLTSSRAAAILGVAPTLAEAERIAEQGALAVSGAVAHRPDIGTAALIDKKIRQLEELKKTK